MKVAHWIRHAHLFRADEFVCSACKAVYNKPYMTCPNCGTHIRKTDYDSSWANEAEEISVILDDDW